MFSPWRTPKPVPNVNPIVPWTLAFGDVAISFPPGRYEVLPSRNERGDEVTVVLLDNDGIAASFIRMPPLEPLRDVFARAGGVVRPSGNEEAFTRKLFGKFPTNLDLLKIAYRHFPSDLTCSDSAAAREIQIAVGLVLKGLGPRNAETLTVHEDLWGLHGITYVGKRKGKSDQWDLETHFETADASYIVGITWKSRAKMDEGLPFVSMKGCRKSCKTVGPDWLVELGKAVSSPLSKTAWERLANALATVSVSNRTARSIKLLVDSGK
ncbi:MAG: hypothetical protein HYY84_20315 [Deltaproteobacteria bacterium]|nr:hypothetical protein [Deltaproteobacteria bacterium]